MTSFPLTRFLIDLPKIRHRDPRELAAEYAINPDHARGYIALELAR